MGRPVDADRAAQPAAPSDDTFQFSAYFLSRGEFTNVSNRVVLNQGQTIGRLFGPNTTQTDNDDRALFFEQRLLPMLTIEPDLTRGVARLRTAFEIDWTFGDTSNGTGPNAGGALAGDHVNLQTQNVLIELRVADGWQLAAGLMRLTDNVRDPYTTSFDELSSTGLRLGLFGSDAVGAALYGEHGEQRIKVAAYQLYENRIERDDDVVLVELATDRHLGRTLHLGASARYLRDTSRGAGGLSVLGQGPGSELASYMGGYRFPTQGEVIDTHLVWVGLDLDYNWDFIGGPYSTSAFVVLNAGQVGRDPEAGIDVLGVLASARAGYRYGRTRADAITAEITFSSGDDGKDDGTYNGIVTGNTWGAPGAVYSSHGAVLLAPHAQVVNRYYGAIGDLSNAGFGVTLFSLSAGYDLVPNRLEIGAGALAAMSTKVPDGGQGFVGAEGNVALQYRIRPLLTVGARAAYLALGNFFRSPEVTDGVRPANPWTGFVTLAWWLG